MSESGPRVEDSTDALVDGDRALVAGTARAALAHRDFRVVWTGMFGSNIGTWMQNVLLGAYGYALTGSAGFVGLLYFAQLGPLLVLATPGGVLADMVNRRRLLIWAQSEQVVFSLLLALLATSHHPSHIGIVACVFAVGIGNAVSAPAMAAVIPNLVPKADLAGAVSLQSVQMNLSRAIGPAIGAALFSAVGASAVFVVNAATYLFLLGALVAVNPSQESNPSPHETVASKLASGFRLAWSDPLVRRILLIMVTFSFFSLAFVGLMPVLADKNFGIGPKSIQYGLLYAGFGLGAALGAVSVGSFLAHRSRTGLVRWGLVAFAILLGAFGSVRLQVMAYPLALLLGYAYFVVTTSLSTVLQIHLEDAVRGRIMALWIMSFGGTVPLGVLVGGALAGHVGITAVIAAGAVVALVLVRYTNLAAIQANQLR
ncbi:MAG: MFS transporter [Acidimicrobiales bacterium]